MKRADLEYVKKVLSLIRPQDQHVAKAIAFVDRDLAIYDATRGQLRDDYDYDYYHFGGR